MGREIKAGLSSQPAASRGSASNRCSVGASWLGLEKCEASGCVIDVEFVGVSAGKTAADSWSGAPVE